MLSKLIQAVNNLNSWTQSRPLILHTDISYIAREYKLSGTNKDLICEEFIKILTNYSTNSYIFIPTFDYSFCQTRQYDKRNDSSDLGALANYCCKFINKYRTQVPIFSHVDIKRSHESDKAEYSTSIAFGVHSFYDWFTKNDGFIAFWGCSLSISNTYIHHIEDIAGIDYRYKKEFSGHSIVSNKQKKVQFNYLVRPTNIDIEYKDQGKDVLEGKNLLFSNIDNKLNAFSCKQFLDESLKLLKMDPYALLTKETRIKISDRLSTSKRIRSLHENKKKILLVSDITYEFALKGWAHDDTCIEAIYNDDIILGLSSLDHIEVVKYDLILIVPSINSFTFGLLKVQPDNKSLIDSNIIDKFDSLSQCIKKIQRQCDLDGVIVLSPFSNIDFAAHPGSEEHILDLKIAYAEIEKKVFLKMQDIGIFYISSIHLTSQDSQICSSELNFLRYRYPYTYSSNEFIRAKIIDAILLFYGLKDPIKAISVDLDNTLWHGIGGDDEVSVNKDYPSNANLRLQVLLNTLKKNGIFLIATTKNERSTVAEIFKRLGDNMVIKEADFTLIQASWEEKSISLRESALTLNINLDSIMHIDDSELECLEIKYALPSVEVVHFSPEKIDTISEAMKCHPRLKRRSLSMSDKNRLNYKPISHLNEKCTSNFEYLSQLKIETEIIDERSDKYDQTRINQLFYKTNQFNNTKSLQKKIRANLENVEEIYYALLYKDLHNAQECCAAICTKEAKDYVLIQGFVMSCRFFSRGLEYYFLWKLLSQNKKAHFKIRLAKSRKNQPFWRFICNIKDGSTIISYNDASVDDTLMVDINHDNVYNITKRYVKHYESF